MNEISTPRSLSQYKQIIMLSIPFFVSTAMKTAPTEYSFFRLSRNWCHTHKFLRAFASCVMISISFHWQLLAK
jgi:hypothetical protein